ncbi:DUF6571 family protein [Kitasatospora kifunensis]|uniref:Uncharacterized protein n=1 Tax=Kitasatospora kifunensis TaxID=58351 RepID=A0A7W7VUM4_KITKI|nr:DUF6571 family protein [Kitasatospora kifunensis]MBB4923491.1 hypothetical protein [Kitasatospora kifunensis]
MAKALRDAHDQFSAAQKALQLVLDDAAQEKLTVSDDGSIGWPAATTDGDTQNPGYESAFQHKAGAIQQRITAVLNQATEADTAAAAAFAADTGSTASGFNSAPVGGISEAEGQQAAQLLSLGGKASDAQIAQLDQLLKEHSGDPRFTTAFYEKLGPNGFLSSWAAMAQKGGGSATATDIQSQLGIALANATHTDNQPHLSDTWEADLRRAGASHFPLSPGEPVDAQPYGYQILSNILRSGNYDAHFLDPIAEHVTQLTRANPTMWDSVSLHHAYPYQDAGVPAYHDIQFLTANGSGFNPMSGALEALGHSPDASTHYFHDPATLYSTDGTARGSDPSLKYLDVLTATGDQSVLMDVASSTSYQPTTGTASPAETLALGHALEAATTGVPYDATGAALPPHTDAMSAVMSDVVSKFGSGDGPSLLHGNGALFANMNGSLGNMTAAYIGDVQKSVAGGDMSPLPGFGKPAQLDPGATLKLVATLGRDPGAYGAITQAQQAYTTAQIQTVMQHQADHGDLLGEAVQNAVHPGAVVEGVLNSARANEVFQHQQASDAAYNAQIDQHVGWATKVWDLTGGKTLSSIPVVGGTLNSQAEASVQQIANSYHIDTSGAASDQASTLLVLGAGSGRATASAVMAGAIGSSLSPTQVQDLANTAVTAAQNGFSYGGYLFTGGPNGGAATGSKG